MNHCVPDFETDEDYSIPASTGLMRPKKSAMGGDEDIMELLWQNGQVVVQSQNQRSGGKKPHTGDVIEQTTSPREIRSVEEVTPPPNLFMQEDEMASWLHYPMDDSSFDRYLYSDVLYPPPAPVSAPISTPSSLPPTSVMTVASRPPIPPSRRVEPEPPTKYQKFVNFSRPRTTKIESGPSTSSKAGKDITIVGSNVTPEPAGNGPESRVARVADSSAAQVSGRNSFRFGTTSDIGGTAAGTSIAGRDNMDTCELTVTSSPETGSGASANASVGQSSQMPSETAAIDRKRKGREADATTDCFSEDLGYECTDGKKQERRSTSAKRSRAAEVHNQSERRRRDRINEKMKALQELIPRCNKSDKASMLDDAIEYLKSLQMQVQMMSMGCSMVPMMFPGVQQYMPPMAMGMGIGMGMGMGMDMGMNRGIVPYPSVIPGSAMLPSAASAAQMAPRFPVPAFQMPPVQVTDPSRVQTSNNADPQMNSFVPQNPNQVGMPHFTIPYQQYLSLQQAQAPIPQTQALMQPCTSKPSSSKEVGNPEHRPTGQ